MAVEPEVAQPAPPAPPAQPRPLPEVLVQCDFEVFGHVQGVGFTKDCRDKCVLQNVRGWVKNSKRGTIVGKMQGTKLGVDAMVHWLSKVGSPGSKIEKAEFTNWGQSFLYDYKEFQIRF